MMPIPFRPFVHRLPLLVAGLGIGAPALVAQQPNLPGEDPDLVDRVVAVAGDSIVLLSQLEEEVLRARAFGVPIPTEPAAARAFRFEVLDGLVNRLLIVQAALEDSTLAVPEADLERVASQQIDQQIRRLGTQAALQQALAGQGMSVASYREFLKNQARQERLQELYLQKSRSGAAPLVIEEEELRAAFELQKDRLPPRTAAVTAEILVIEPEPSDSAREAARLEAERILGLIREGEDFETLARRFSGDPGSAAQGGDLGWFRRGVMVPAFEDMTFQLREGEVSTVVETPFGAHVIQLERIRAAERKARHILIPAVVGEADVGEARARAEEAVAQLRGGEDLGALRARFKAERPAPFPDSIDLPVDRLGELPEGFEALATASAGDLLGPIPFEMGGSRYFAIVNVVAVRAAGPTTYEDVRTQLRAQLQQQKAVDAVVERLRGSTWVELRL